MNFTWSNAVDGEDSWLCGETLQKHNIVPYIIGETECHCPTSGYRWMTSDEGWGREKESRDRGERGRSKREIKRTSVENDCLFDEGWLRSDKVKRALLRRVWSLKRGKIGRAGRRRGQNMWKETQRGKKIEREQTQRERERESGCFKKHLGAIRERREKRWTQLKLSAPLATLLAYSPASHPTNTFPQKTQSRGGRVQSIRESLSSASSYSPQTTRSAVKVDHALLTNGIRLRSTHCKTLAVNDIQTRNFSCLRFIWSCKSQHIKIHHVMFVSVQAYTVLACVSSALSPASIDHLKNSTCDVRGGSALP